jgi:small-conductance mechanosensitive channel
MLLASKVVFWVAVAWNRKRATGFFEGFNKITASAFIRSILTTNFDSLITHYTMNKPDKEKRWALLLLYQSLNVIKNESVTISKAVDIFMVCFHG